MLFVSYIFKTRSYLLFSLGWLGIHYVTDTDFKLILRSVWNTQIADMCCHTWFITFFFKNAVVYRNVWASYFAYYLHVKKPSWFCVLTFACDPFFAFLSVSMAVWDFLNIYKIMPFTNGSFHFSVLKWMSLIHFI